MNKFKVMPIVISIFIGIFIYNFKFNIFSMSGIKDEMNSIVTFVSIVFGFYVGMFGVLISITSTNIMKRILNDKKSRRELNDVMMMAITSSLIVLVVTIAIQISGIKYPTYEIYHIGINMEYLISGLWIGILVYFLIRTL
ncbi:hypothetical protein WKK_01105 [Weissella koreensis KACC 15510]|uniref:hypothetical protein n=1 Tax=Weissella koreensis TaxID=165096 RepID=UPI00021743E8|nr:hypothetical protein [Weissella koreensis]AEJ23097.1 hypothetical protein WKK_01105 [Weissella koreensis KACC 15510]